MSNLTKAKCNALTRPGLPGDGGGLYLLVKSTGGKPWIQRITIQGKRRDLGLGSFPHVTLSKARAAALNRATVADGGDPLAGKRRGQVPRLRAAAATVYELHRPRWRSSKHAADGWATLERQALPRLGDIKVDAISRIDLLTPIWTSKPETARRVRQRVRTVMKRAVVARGHIEHNPAGEVIDGALPAMPKGKAHLRALPYFEVPTILALIDQSRSSLVTRTCLRLLILTAARSGTARGARWNEIDPERREWLIPGTRMKSGTAHRVPLSDAALAVLDCVQPLRDADGLVFPSPRRSG